MIDIDALESTINRDDLEVHQVELPFVVWVALLPAWETRIPTISARTTSFGLGATIQSLGISIRSLTKKHELLEIIIHLCDRIYMLQIGSFCLQK